MSAADSHSIFSIILRGREKVKENRPNFLQANVGSTRFRCCPTGGPVYKAEALYGTSKTRRVCCSPASLMDSGRFATIVALLSPRPRYTRLATQTFPIVFSCPVRSLCLTGHYCGRPAPWGNTECYCLHPAGPAEKHLDSLDGYDIMRSAGGYAGQIPGTDRSAGG